MHISYYKQSSEESFVQECNVPFQILLSFFQNPFLKVDEVEGMRIFYFFCFDPFNEKGKMISDLFPIKNSVYHVTTKETHFDFVSSMRINTSVLVN